MRSFFSLAYAFLLFSWSPHAALTPPPPSPTYVEASVIMGGHLGGLPIGPSSPLQTYSPNPTHSHAHVNIKATSPPPSTTCKQTYGILPCTRSIVGGVFLLLVYGYIIFSAARFLAEGSELLLVVLDTGIVGGLILPIFGVFPDSILILVSGIGGSSAEAQEEVLVGIGLLAGSNIMLLTLLWGTCLILGRCDLVKDSFGKVHATEKQLSKKFDLCGTGVEIDKTTRISAAIMCASIIPLLIAQIPHIFHISPKSRLHVIIACILSFLGLLIYCTYQVMTPTIKRRRKLKAIHNLITFRVLKYSTGEGTTLLGEGGKVNKEVLRRMFYRLDQDNDGKLTRDEVRVMLHVSSIEEKINDNVVEQFMRDFDTNDSNTISWEEFLDGMERQLKTTKPNRIYSIDGLDPSKIEEYLTNIEEIIENIKEVSPMTKPKIIRKSCLLLLTGVVLVGIFAEPLVDAVTDFSHASHIPSFFVSFVLLPIASNASESISSIIFASYKQKVNMSLTYSQIYGAVAMNNTMSLGILLALIYARRLEWNFSSEVLIICLVTLVMGILALSRRVLPFWMSFFALLLYPLAIAIVAILDHVVGWK